MQSDEAARKSRRRPRRVISVVLAMGHTQVRAGAPEIPHEIARIGKTAKNVKAQKGEYSGVDHGSHTSAAQILHPARSWSAIEPLAASISQPQVTAMTDRLLSCM